MRAFAIGTMVSGVLGVPVMLAAASVYGLTGSAVALVINAFISAAISRYQMANELKKFCIPVNSNGCLREWRILWGFALPALLSSALIAPAHWAVQAMLARTSNGYAELAVLGIAMQWFNVIMFLPGTAGRIVLPILSSRLENNIQNRLPQKIAFYAAGLNAFLSIPILIAVIIGAQHIMGLYGQAYVKDYPVLVLAAFAAIANAIHGPLNSLIVSESRVWLSAFFVAIWAFVYVGIAYTAIKLGAFGVMLGLTIGHVVFAICAIVTIFFYQRRNANIG